MRKHFILLILSLCATTLSFAQSNFYKSFYITNLYDVIKTNDNGFACLTFNGGILKLDSNTHPQFYKELSSTSTLFFYKIIQTTDSGFIIETPYNPFNSNGIGCVVKFDKNGNYLWTQKYYYPTYSSNSIKDIISSDNNGFYLLASGCVGSPLLIKCNASGDIIWQKKSSYTAGAMKILRYADNKFLIAGISVVNDYLRKINLYLVDTSGTYLWLKQYSNNGVNLINEITKISDNEYSLLIYSQDSTTSGLHSTNITMRVDSSGNVLWAKKRLASIPIHYNTMNSLVGTNDGGYLSTGYLALTTTASRIVYSKTDSMNNIEWTRYFGNAAHNNGGTNEGIKIIKRNGDYFVFILNR